MITAYIAIGFVLVLGATLTHQAKHGRPIPLGQVVAIWLLWPILFPLALRKAWTK